MFNSFYRHFLVSYLVCYSYNLSKLVRITWQGNTNRIRRNRGSMQRGYSRLFYVDEQGLWIQGRRYGE